MCGLFGITRFKTDDLEKAREALHSMTHRGPDQWGDYYDRDIYMGHRRLSILDLSPNGKQPMISEDTETVISVNGEIYNYRELKKELSARYRFRSESDSEVILHGYNAWGIDKLLDRIDGMYAISLYDKRKRKVYLARDRAGIKPLYYSTIGEQLLYASELKAITKYYEDDPPEQDKTALYDFLTYLYIPAPKTLYRNIHKLEPGHYLEADLDSGDRKHTRYWSLDPSAGSGHKDAAEHLAGLVTKSVNEQMMSDVPVGFFLSGGLDSSIIVAAASAFNNNMSTFTIGFREKNYDESEYANLVAEKFNTRHYCKILDVDTLNGLVPKIREWYDEPFGDVACFPTYLLSKYAKENSTVILTGDGSDELFGGYKWYRRYKTFSNLNIPFSRTIRSLLGPVKNRQNLAARAANRIEYQFLLSGLELYTKLLGGMLKEEKVQYGRRWEIEDDYDDYWYFRKYDRPDLDTFTRLQYLDFHTILPDRMLTKTDRASMAVSLECRVPFLSKDIIEYVFSLPESIRFPNGEQKGLLKAAFRKELPEEILSRPKKGFNIPLDKWAVQELGGGLRQQEKILNSIFSDIR